MHKSPQLAKRLDIQSEKKREREKKKKRKKRKKIL
jgi:hypothetical protein